MANIEVNEKIMYIDISTSLKSKILKHNYPAGFFKNFLTDFCLSNLNNKVLRVLRSYDNWHSVQNKRINLSIRLAFRVLIANALIIWIE